MHRELLSPELNRDIKELWRTSAIGRAPDRHVTLVLPHAGVWDAFGPALQFGYRISLAAFGNTEGLTYFDYGLVDIADNCREELDAMQALGHPVDCRFFKDLTAAAHRRGEPEGDEDDERTTRHEIGAGLAFEASARGLPGVVRELRNAEPGERESILADRREAHRAAAADLKQGPLKDIAAVGVMAVGVLAAVAGVLEGSGVSRRSRYRQGSSGVAPHDAGSLLVPLRGAAYARLRGHGSALSTCTQSHGHHPKSGSTAGLRACLELSLSRNPPLAAGFRLRGLARRRPMPLPGPLLGRIPAGAGAIPSLVWGSPAHTAI